MDVAIFFLLYKTGVVCKREFGGMFQNEGGARFQNPRGQYGVGDGFKGIYVVGRVGKDKVVLQGADFQEIKYVVMYHLQLIGHGQESCGVFDEAGMQGVHLNAGYPGAAA